MRVRQPSLAIGALVISTSNPSVLYAVTGGGNVQHDRRRNHILPNGESIPAMPTLSLPTPALLLCPRLTGSTGRR